MGRLWGLRAGGTALVASLTCSPLMAACTPDQPVQPTRTVSQASDRRTLEVQATETSCLASDRVAPAGRLRFSVANDGAKVTDFQLLDAEDQSVVGEIVDISPGLTRDLVVTVAAGEYLMACRPGPSGESSLSHLLVIHSVTDPPPSVDDRVLVAQARANYAAYLRLETNALVDQTQAFVDAYTAGRDAAARRRYAPARQSWERIEVVGGSLGSLDQRIDQREAEVPAGRRWTGWHRIEKDLWPPQGYQQLSPGQRQTYGLRLLADTRELRRRASRLALDDRDIASVSLELAEEASRKVAGEEESWSHTDLWDIEGNIDGAEAAYLALRPVLRVRQPDLAMRLTARFRDVQGQLLSFRTADGFRDYSSLSRDEIKALSDALHALSEPLSHLPAVMG